MKRKSNLLANALLCMMLLFIASCGDDEIADDPGGTVTVFMKNYSNLNSGTSILPDGCDAYSGRLYIDGANNFSGEYWEFSSIGSVKGLGNVRKIPESGWSDKIAVLEGYGYVGRYRYGCGPCLYIRLYVVEFMTSDGSQDVIGAQVKYAPLEENIGKPGKIKTEELYNLPIGRKSNFSDWNLWIEYDYIVNPDDCIFNGYGKVEIVSVGKINDLEAIKKVPSDGWSETVKIVSDYGYIARARKGASYIYMRIYVNSFHSPERYNYEAKVTFQYPFIPEK